MRAWLLLAAVLCGSCIPRCISLPVQYQPQQPHVSESKKQALEVQDMLNISNSSVNMDTVTVDHPNVVTDTGKTHEEEVKPRETTVLAENEQDSASNVSALSATSTDTTFHVCTLPKFWVRGEAVPDPESQDWWSENGGNSSCNLREWSGRDTNSTIHVCSIPGEWLRQNNYTIHDDNALKQLLVQRNTTNINCVTRAEVLSEDYSDNTIANGSILQGWLRASEDNIYIYLVPKDWFKHVDTTNAVNSTVVNTQINNSNTTDNNTVNSSETNNGNTTNNKSVNQQNGSSVIHNNTANEQEISSNNATKNGFVNQSQTVNSDATTTNNVQQINSESENATSNTINQSEINRNATGNTENVLPVNDTSNSSVNVLSTISTDTSGNTTAPWDGIKTGNTTTTLVQLEMNTTVHNANTVTVNFSGNATGGKHDIEYYKYTVHNVDYGTSTTIEEPQHNVVNHKLEEQQQPHVVDDHTGTSKTAFLQPTESAAILAGVFVGIALLGYVGLLVWRKFTERQRGNREMLVNDDDDFDTRHFEL